MRILAQGGQDEILKTLQDLSKGFASINNDEPFRFSRSQFEVTASYPFMKGLTLLFDAIQYAISGLNACQGDVDGTVEKYCLMGQQALSGPLEYGANGFGP